MSYVYHIHKVNQLVLTTNSFTTFIHNDNVPQMRFLNGSMT